MQWLSIILPALVNCVADLLEWADSFPHDSKALCCGSARFLVQSIAYFAQTARLTPASLLRLRGYSIAYAYGTGFYNHGVLPEHCFAVLLSEK
jgi:hypothetical protein